MTPKAPPPACARHPDARAVGKCLHCQASICSECRRSFGYYCSPEHKGQARDRAGAVLTLAPQSEKDREALARSRKVLRILKLSACAAAGLVVLYLGVSWLLAGGGELRWEADLGEGYVSQVEAVPEGVRVILDRGRLLGYDERGERTLARDLGIRGFGEMERIGDIGLFREDEGLRAVSLADGRVLWKTPAEDLDRGDQVACEGTRLYVLAWREPPQLLALDGASGTALWKQPLEGLPGPFGMAAGSGHVCVSSRGAGPEAKAAAIVVSAQDGRLLWRLGPEHDVLDRPEMMPQGLVMASSDGLRMYRWSDGKEAWFHPIGLGEVKDKRKGALGRTVEAPERLLKKMWSSGDGLFVAVGQGLLCLDGARGKLRWGIRVGGEVGSWLESEGQLVLSVATSRDVTALLKEQPVFVASDQMADIIGKEFGGLRQANEFTLAVDPATGARRWAIPQGGRALGSAEGIVLCETRSGMALLKPGMQAFEQQTSICLVDASSGRVRWQVWREGGVTSPVIAGGAVVFAAASWAGGTIGRDGQPKPPSMSLVAISLR